MKAMEYEFLKHGFCLVFPEIGFILISCHCYRGISLSTLDFKHFFFILLPIFIRQLNVRHLVSLWFFSCLDGWLGDSMFTISFVDLSIGLNFA